MGKRHPQEGLSERPFRGILPGKGHQALWPRGLAGADDAGLPERDSGLEQALQPAGASGKATVLADGPGEEWGRLLCPNRIPAGGQHQRRGVRVLFQHAPKPGRLLREHHRRYGEAQYPGGENRLLPGILRLSGQVQPRGRLQAPHRACHH